MHHTNSEFHLMHAYGIYLMALHQQDLLEEAEISRRVKLAQRSQPGIPAWRRGLGGVLASAARSIDPSIGERSAKGSGARALAA
jgi:hypothetical protein